MNAITGTFAATVATRARQSLGVSDVAIYGMVAGALAARHKGGGVLIDIGCGSGKLWPFLQQHFARYIGIDVVAYDGFPPDGEFIQANLDANHPCLPADSGDVVTAVETIEHLENPRAFIRELVRLTKPGGWVVVTTPNQLSLLSVLTLVFKKQFSAFQDVHYPAHISALLETDLTRIAAECGLDRVSIAYSLQGRLVLTSRHYPGALSKLFPGALSDNLLLIGSKAL